MKHNYYKCMNCEICGNKNATEFFDEGFQEYWILCKNCISHNTYKTK